MTLQNLQYNNVRFILRVFGHLKNKQKVSNVFLRKLLENDTY